jgi:hypothetical protein
MKILIACHGIVYPAGSELYHFELCKELSYHIPNLTLAVLNDFELNPHSKLFPMVQILKEHGVKLIQLKDIDPNEKYDLIIASQPYVNNFLCELFPLIPKISIIHSPYRSEEPIFHDSIKHYIAVDVFILQFLKNQIKIPIKDISLIFNGIDFNKFNKNYKYKLERTTGVFIGGWNDPLRNRMFNHICDYCIENDWDLYVIGTPFPDQSKPSNIKFFTGIYNTEIFTRCADFTVGLGGRTTIEGWAFDVPSYIYKTNPTGDILDIQLKYPPKMERFNIKYVAQQHLKLYKKILNESNI